MCAKQSMYLKSWDSSGSIKQVISFTNVIVMTLIMIMPNWIFGENVWQTSFDPSLMIYIQNSTPAVGFHPNCVCVRVCREEGGWYESLYFVQITFRHWFWMLVSWSHPLLKVCSTTILSWSSSSESVTTPNLTESSLQDFTSQHLRETQARPRKWAGGRGVDLKLVMVG